MSAAPGSKRTLVWDAPVRVFHWLLALSVLGAFVTAESERWRLVHATLGYSAGGLVAFRLLWGFIGTRHARFSSFVRGPAAVLRYLGSLVTSRPEHHVGHNPAGALAIVALLALTALVSASGHMVYADLGGRWLESLHEFTGEAMMLLVGVHVGAVLLSSALHRENLVGSMLSGRKAAPAAQGIRAPHRILAAVLATAVFGFWAIQWSEPPAGAVPVAARSVGDSRAEHD
jgi:cytochrome b